MASLVAGDLRVEAMLAGAGFAVARPLLRVPAGGAALGPARDAVQLRASEAKFGGKISYKLRKRKRHYRIFHHEPPWWVPLTGKKLAKQKQAARSLERLTSQDKKRKKAKADKKDSSAWPPEIEKGVTLLHVEYGEDPDSETSGVEELNVLFALMASRFGSKVRIAANNRFALKALSPSGEARKSAFEIVDVHGDRLLYSRLQTGTPLLSGDPNYLNKWVEIVGEKCGIS